MKLRDTIKEITKNHLAAGGILCAQNITGVGALQNTINLEDINHPNIIEFPTSDVSNGSIACGFSLAKRTIFAIRFQGFVTYNATSIVNYAAKSKEMWGVACPIFVRSICNEGHIGPVASNSHTGAIMRFPGINVFSPITSNEWQYTWDYYMSSDDPMYCSEHRSTFDIDYEVEDIINENNEVVVFAIGYGRVNAIQAITSLQFPCSLIHLFQLKPLKYNEHSIDLLKKSKFGIVIDSDYEVCGASRSIAYELMLLSGKPVYALGLENRTAGFAKHCDNITPSPEKICQFIKEKIDK